MIQIHKCFLFYSFLTVTSGLAVITLASASLAIPPSTDWSIRGTGLSSSGECYRRARRAMEGENLRDIRTSGDNGFKGEIRSTRAYIICQDNGGRAYIFCAGDISNRICDNLARYMKK